MRWRTLEQCSYWAAIPLALLAGLVGVASMIVHWQVPFIFSEHPQEYSENAIYLTTVLLLRGQNPWGLENFPQFVNVYGIGYNLVALPLAAVFGCTFAVHRLLSAALLLACCVVIVLVMRRYRTPTPLALAGVAVFYQQYMPTHASEIRPDNLGLLLFLGALFYPWWRRFSAASLCVASGLSLLALCTKFYFAVAILYLAVYLFLFENKKKAVIYLVLSLIAVRLLGALVDAVCMAYWPAVFFMQINESRTDASFLVDQLSWYVHKNWAVLSVLVLLALAQLYTKLRAPVPAEATRVARGPSQILTPLGDFRAPLLRVKVDFVTFALAFSCLLILVRVGWRPGNFGVYFHQLITPFLVIVVFRALPRTRWPRALLIALPCLQLVLARSGVAPLRPAPPHHWEQWEALLSGHHEVFAAPQLAHILDRQGKPVYDAGHAMYMRSALKGPPRSAAEQLAARLRAYEGDIRDKIARGVFTLIVQKHDYYHRLISPELLAQRYRLVEQRECWAGCNSGRFDLWIPLDAPTSSEAHDRGPPAGDKASCP